MQKNYAECNHAQSVLHQKIDRCLVIDKIKKLWILIEQLVFFENFKSLVKNYFKKLKFGRDLLNIKMQNRFLTMTGAYVSNLKSVTKNDLK